MTLCLGSSFTRLFYSYTFFSDFQLFWLSITEETWLVEMSIWCIKIGIVLVLHLINTNGQICNIFPCSPWIKLCNLKINRGHRLFKMYQSTKFYSVKQSIHKILRISIFTSQVWPLTSNFLTPLSIGVTYSLGCTSVLSLISSSKGFSRYWEDSDILISRVNWPLTFYLKICSPSTYHQPTYEI
jgi:hypothetical protein